MQLDGLLFEGPFDMSNANAAWMIGLFIWLLGLGVTFGLIYLRREEFNPQFTSTDNSLAVLGNFIFFSGVVVLQVAVESILIWGSRPVHNVQDLTEANLWPWILGHFAAGPVWLLLIVAIWGKKEMDTFIFYSAFPTAIATFGLLLLGIVGWPSVFSFPLVTATVIGSQFIVIGVLSIPVGLFVIYLFAQLFIWLFS
jgi:hypothetical protein